MTMRVPAAESADKTHRKAEKIKRKADKQQARHEKYAARVQKKAGQQPPGESWSDGPPVSAPETEVPIE